MIGCLLLTRQGRIQDFHLGGGGAKEYYARTHITSAKSEVPFDRDPLMEPLSMLLSKESLHGTLNKIVRGRSGSYPYSWDVPLQGQIQDFHL